MNVPDATREPPARPGPGRLRPWVGAALLLAGLPAAAQLPGAGQPAGETGSPFLTSYEYRDYEAHSQNWAVAQDQRGVLYFGNGSGVLEFDGVRWRIIPVANESIVRSLAVDGRGTVYAGAVGEVGTLRPDGRGVLTYVSLTGELDPEDRDLGNVWRTWAIGDAIYFWSQARLLRWADGRFRSWEIDSALVPSVVDGRLFYLERDAGLRVLQGDALLPVAGGELLADLSLMVLLPHGRNRVLAGTRDGRFFTFSLQSSSPAPQGARPPADGAEGGSGYRLSELERWDTEAGALLGEHKLYHGVRLPGGAYAFATMTGGLLLVGREGELVRRFSRADGLGDDAVWSLYVDRQQGLWLALNRGLARIELGSPVTAIGETAGLEGTVEAVARHDGELYVATNLGVYRLGPDRPEKIHGAGAPYWSLLSLDAAPLGRPPDPRLLIGASFGVFELRDGEVRELARWRETHQLYRSLAHPAIVYVGEGAGLGALQLADGEWLDRGRLAAAEEVRSIAEGEDGEVWLGTLFDGVLRLAVAAEPVPRVTAVERFGPGEGLPTPNSVKIRRLAGQLVFATPEGLYRFDPAARTFAPSPLLGPRLADGSTGILRLSPDRDDNVWMSLYEGDLAVAWRRSDGSYTLDDTVLNRIAGRSIHAVLPEPGGAVWFGGVEGLFRFDSTPGGPFPGVRGTDRAAAEPPAAAFSTLIRSVSVIGLAAAAESGPAAGGHDGPRSTVIYGGAAAPGGVPVLEYASNSLRFEYALPRFDAAERNRYRSRLVGLDDSWSNWTAETYRDFTALREGRYRFEVEGRDIFLTSGGVAAFDLRVLPPWYRTLWAYGVYVLALLAAIWGVFAWQLRRVRLKMELRRLEEANALMRRSERQRERFVRQLEAQNAEMERFIYTVSHDLKSPLITIRGFLGLLEKDVAEGRSRRMQHDIERIHRAAGRMAELVNDLLELSRVGRVAHEPRQVSLGALAREAAEQLAGPLAERRVDLVISPRLPAAWGDPRRLREMLQNLIENAVKYMGEEPEPRVEIDFRQNGSEVVYVVRDNGIGIDPRYQEKVFGLFERLESATEGTEGTGVGLALVQRIVEVHGGCIWVESEGEGRGSTFCFTLAPAPPEAAG